MVAEDRLGRMRWSRAWAWLLVCGVIGGPAQGGAQAPARLAEVVPDEILAYVELTDARGLLERLTDPRYREIVSDLEAIAEPGPRKQWGELVAGATYVASQLGTKPETLLREIAGGGAAIAVAGKDRVAGWIEARDADLLRRAHGVVLNLARRDDKNGGPTVTEHGGITIYEFDKTLAHAIVGPRLVFASSRETLCGLLDRLAGVGEKVSCLADSEAFRVRDAARPREAWAWAYADLERVRAADPKAFQGKPEDEAGQRLLFGPWIEALRAGKWATLTMGPAGSGWMARLEMDRPTGESAGRFAGFVPPEGEGPAPLLRPEGTLLSVSLYRDLEKVWDARAELLPAEAQAGLAQLDTFAGQFFGGRDFASGVLGALTPRWRFVVVAQDHEAIEPTPGTRLPGFAVVLGLKPGDDEFAIRLTSAFQSFVGLVNLGAAQQKAPPLMLGATDVDGISVSTAAFVPPKGAVDGEADVRFNFSPSAARVGDAYVIASSVQTARALVPLLKAESGSEIATGLTMLAEGEGDEAARLIGLNVGALRMRRMLEKGKDREAAEADVAAMGRLVERLGRVRLEASDRDGLTRFELRVAP